MKMDSINCLGSKGHIGYFTEPDHDSIYFEGVQSGLKAALHPGVIKFNGDSLPPFLQIQRNSNNSFTIFGAFFSLLFETAKRINYSLIGLAPTPEWSEEEFLKQMFRFRSDVALFPLDI